MISCDVTVPYQILAHGVMALHNGTSPKEVSRARGISNTRRGRCVNAGAFSFLMVTLDQTPLLPLVWHYLWTWPLKTHDIHWQIQNKLSKPNHLKLSLGQIKVKLTNGWTDRWYQIMLTEYQFRLFSGVGIRSKLLGHCQLIPWMLERPMWWKIGKQN